MKVFVVKHSTDYAFGDSTKSGIEGVYSSRERAEQEMLRYYMEYQLRRQVTTK